MKAINNTYKISKMFSFLMFLSFITLTAYTQKSYTNTSMDELVAGIYHNNKSDIAEVFTYTSDSKFSEEVIMEDWMTNPFEWSAKTESTLVMNPEFYNDEQVEIENWMTEPVWNASITEEIQIENWMTTPVWNTAVTEEIQIEEWMTVPVWNIVIAEEIQIEKWMTTPENWNDGNVFV